jgi:hypothetical protein
MICDILAGELRPRLNGGDVVKLDVGGMKFTTTVATLQNIPGSMLSTMFSGRHTISLNSEGYYFIDRDGTQFRHILNMLRSPGEYKLALSKSDMLELEHEARYYCLLDAFESAKEPAVSAEWKITAVSAGFNVHRTDHPNYRSFVTSQKETTPDGGRGWNIVLLHPDTRKILANKSFDFYGGGNAVVNACCDFLEGVPVGTIVAMAVHDDGATHMTGRFTQLLKQFGAKDASIEFRASFALVGRKGMQPGEATQQYHRDGSISTATMTLG